MTNAYDEFDPWSAQKVEQCVLRLAEITRASSNAEDAKTVARNCEELDKFGKLYVRMFECMTDPDFVRDDTKFHGLLKMIKVRHRLETGAIDDRTATSLAADIVLETSRTPQSNS